MPHEITESEGVKMQRELFHIPAIFADRSWDHQRAHGKDTEVQHLQDHLFTNVFRRINDPPVDPDDLVSMARVLLFSDSDIRIMNTMIHLLGATELEKHWFRANVDQANHLIKTLVGGNATPYPDVDCPCVDNTNGAYAELIFKLVCHLEDRDVEAALYDRFAVVSAIYLLNDFGRLEENIELKWRENNLAMNYAVTLNYRRWRYGAVVILGHSPTAEESSAGERLALMAKDKIERAVRMNESQNLAPLYILCGGSVRPRKTDIVESYEMKKHMVDEYKVMDHHMIMDTTSQHMYSNFMNAVLIAFEVGMPLNTKLLVLCVPDRYGMEDQFDFSMNRLMARAHDEVFPRLDDYFGIRRGNGDRTIELVLEGTPADFLAPMLLWKDYTGELQADSRTREGSEEYLPPDLND